MRLNTSLRSLRNLRKRSRVRCSTANEALILVLLLFISAVISDSDIPKKARVVLISGFILAIVP